MMASNTNRIPEPVEGLPFSSTRRAEEGQGFDKLSHADVGRVAKQFEAIFLRQMIATMRAPSLGDDIFGSDASNQFRDMADARLADSMAGQFGIAQLIEKQLAK
jgi:peptidoglycan hydrolase FlgJ